MKKKGENAMKKIDKMLKRIREKNYHGIIFCDHERDGLFCPKCREEKKEGGV